MSEQPNADAPATDAPVDDDAQQKPTETVEFWKQKAREQESRAKSNSAAAKRLGEIEDAAKSDAQRSSDRITALEAEVQGAQRNALRFKVASEHGIDGVMAELLLTGSDEDTLTRQAKAIKQESDTRKKHGNVVPREGATPTPVEGTDRETVRGLFGAS